jgi:hypothetical protein
MNWDEKEIFILGSGHEVAWSLSLLPVDLLSQVVVDTYPMQEQKRQYSEYLVSQKTKIVLGQTAHLMHHRKISPLETFFSNVTVVIHLNEKERFSLGQNIKSSVSEFFRSKVVDVSPRLKEKLHQLTNDQLTTYLDSVWNRWAKNSMTQSTKELNEFLMRTKKEEIGAFFWDLACEVYEQRHQEKLKQLVWHFSYLLHPSDQLMNPKNSGQMYEFLLQLFSPLFYFDTTKFNKEIFHYASTHGTEFHENLETELATLTKHQSLWVFTPPKNASYSHAANPLALMGREIPQPSIEQESLYLELDLTGRYAENEFIVGSLKIFHRDLFLHHLWLPKRLLANSQLLELVEGSDEAIVVTKPCVAQRDLVRDELSADLRKKKQSSSFFLQTQGPLSYWCTLNRLLLNAYWEKMFHQKLSH